MPLPLISLASRIGIVGGGIAGLSMAAFLRLAGFRNVHIFDRCPYSSSDPRSFEYHQKLYQVFSETGRRHQNSTEIDPETKAFASVGLRDGIVGSGATSIAAVRPNVAREMDQIWKRSLLGSCRIQRFEWKLAFEISKINSG